MSDAEFNPYQPPQAPTGPPPASIPPPGRLADEEGTYRSLRTRAALAVAALGLSIVLGLAGVGSSYMQVEFLHRAQAGEPVTPESAQANDTRVTAVAVAQLVATLLVGLTFLMWMYRARGNLPALGAHGLKYGPGWTIGGWFVPVLNFIRPYQIMEEIARASDPRALATTEGNRKALPGLRVVGAWWLCLFVSSAISRGLRAYERTAEKAESIDAYLNLSWGLIVEEAVGILASVLAILVVLRITARQEAKARRLAGAENAEEPWVLGPDA